MKNIVTIKNNLMYKVRQACKQEGWSHPWVFANDIFIRRERNGTPIKIEDMDDLEMLLKDANE